MRTITAKPYDHTPWEFSNEVTFSTNKIKWEVATLYYPGHPLHGKKVFKEYNTKRYKDGKWGRQRISYSIETDKKPFPRLSDLVNYYSGISI